MEKIQFNQKNRDLELKFDFLEDRLSISTYRRWYFNSQSYSFRYEDIDFDDETSIEEAASGFLGGALIAGLFGLVFILSGAQHHDNVFFAIGAAIILAAATTFLVARRMGLKYTILPARDGGRVIVYHDDQSEKILEEISKRSRAKLRALYFSFDPTTTLSNQQNKYEWLLRKGAITESEYQAFMKMILEISHNSPAESVH
ncbi:MAG: hypothetical protein AB7S81_06215 [Bdellovibrionales bacterium]